METEKSRHVPSSQWVISNTQQAIVKKSLDLQKKISMTSFSCPPVYVKRAIVDIEEQMRKSLAHFLNSLHVEVVQNIKINQEKFDRQHFIFFPHFLKLKTLLNIWHQIL